MLRDAQLYLRLYPTNNPDLWSKNVLQCNESKNTSDFSGKRTATLKQWHANIRLHRSSPAHTHTHTDSNSQTADNFLPLFPYQRHIS